MTGKDRILSEIKRLANERGGSTPGRDQFIRETGISEYDFGRYWPRWSEAVAEAGLAPNKLQTEKYSDSELLNLLAKLSQQLGHIPVRNELRIERRKDSAFPDAKVFDSRFGNRRGILERLLEFAGAQPKLRDVAEMANAKLDELPKSQATEVLRQEVGFVYLIKMDKWHKIGRTTNILKRTGEIRITLPEREVLVHTITTVDPSGVETYWHKRFDSRRRQGEWFLLTPQDVQEFKRWRIIS